jgi:hypothetical protein
METTAGSDEGINVGIFNTEVEDNGKNLKVAVDADEDGTGPGGGGIFVIQEPGHALCPLVKSTEAAVLASAGGGVYHQT